MQFPLQANWHKYNGFIVSGSRVRFSLLSYLSSPFSPSSLFAHPLFVLSFSSFFNVNFTPEFSQWRWGVGEAVKANNRGSKRGEAEDHWRLLWTPGTLFIFFHLLSSFYFQFFSLLLYVFNFDTCRLWLRRWEDQCSRIQKDGRSLNTPSVSTTTLWNYIL